MKKSLVKEILADGVTEFGDDEFYTVYAASITKAFHAEHAKRLLQMNTEFVEMRFKAMLKRGGIKWLVMMTMDPIEQLMAPNNNYNLAKYFIQDLVEEETGIAGASAFVVAVKKNEGYLPIDRLQLLVTEEINRRDRRKRT